MRITVKRVLLELAKCNREDLRQAYPDLEDEDIRQALAYAAANLEDQIEEPVPLRGDSRSIRISRRKWQSASDEIIEWILREKSEELTRGAAITVKATSIRVRELPVLPVGGEGDV